VKTVTEREIDELWGLYNNYVSINNRLKEVRELMDSVVSNYLRKPIDEIGPDEYWETARKACPSLVDEYNELMNKESEISRTIRIKTSEIKPFLERADDNYIAIISKTAKYQIKAGDKTYYANSITLDNGYVRFKPLLIDNCKPTEELKEVIVRADEIIDPDFGRGIEIKEILLSMLPIIAMFILPKVLR